MPWFVDGLKPWTMTLNSSHQPFSPIYLWSTITLPFRSLSLAHQNVFSGMYDGQLQGRVRVVVAIALLTQVEVSALEPENSSFAVIVILCS